MRSARRLAQRSLRLAAVLAALVLLRLPAGAAATDASGLNVCPTCQFQTISAALAAAAPGDRITVDGGRYPGGLVIDRPVRLVAENGALIDAGEHGTAVTITAPDVTLQGFTIRGTGISLDHEDAAILVDAARASILGNRIADALFGIYLKNGHGSVVQDNVVAAKNLPVGERGDAIRIWYSNNVRVEHNVASNGRDVILWFSNDGIVRDNVFSGDRYGLHLMYSDRATIEGNELRDNSVGIYIMYSAAPSIHGNTIADNNGPTGMGIGLKAVDNADLAGNRFVSNRIGLQVDESPSSGDATVTISGNVFAYNGSGIAFLPNVRFDTVVGNDFIDNSEQVAVLGGGKLQDITWSVDGHGNYWSDYAGYDANRDGIGDKPYRAQNLFESLVDEHESLRLFLYSPVVTAIDFAAKAFPDVRPDTKLVDAAPLMHPVAVPESPEAATRSLADRVVPGGLGLLAVIGGILMMVALRRRSNPAPAAPAAPATVAAAGPRALAPASADSADAIIRATGLTKRYGAMTAVDGATFEIGRGQSLALWGPNGAGKTTILRCLLGMAQYTGEIRIDGLEPQRDGRDVRRKIGFVPQELPVLAMTVGETVRFIAGLKHASLEQAQEQLRLLGIEDQVDKPIAALSGGQRQRLSLALALIGKPSILLLDEPTANIDAHGRAELLELLRRLRLDGMTLVFASHRPEDVLMLADEVLMIAGGAIQERISRERFLEGLESETKLLLYLEQHDIAAAVDELNRLGCEATASGRVVSIATGGRSKGQIVGQLARAGVVFDDFAVERGAWNAR